MSTSSEPRPPADPPWRSVSHDPAGRRAEESQAGAPSRQKPPPPRRRLPRFDDLF